MDESQADKISQFTGVTGVDADRAKFYLESAAWSVDVSTFSVFCWPLDKEQTEFHTPGVLASQNANHCSSDPYPLNIVDSPQFALILNSPSMNALWPFILPVQNCLDFHS